MCKKHKSYRSREVRPVQWSPTVQEGTKQRGRTLVLEKGSAEHDRRRESSAGQAAGQELSMVDNGHVKMTGGSKNEGASPGAPGTALTTSAGRNDATWKHLRSEMVSA